MKTVAEISGFLYEKIDIYTKKGRDVACNVSTFLQSNK